MTIAGKYQTKTEHSKVFGFRLFTFDNLGCSIASARHMNIAVFVKYQDEWRNNTFKLRKARLATKSVLGDDEQTSAIMEIVNASHEC